MVMMASALHPSEDETVTPCFRIDGYYSKRRRGKYAPLTLGMCARICTRNFR